MSCVKNAKYVNGGFGDVKTIASTTFNDAGLPVLPARAECTFYRMSRFYESIYPAGTTFGPDGDIDAFYFPAFNDKFGTPILGAGEFFAAFSDRPEVQAFQYFTTTPEYANAIGQQGFLSANRGLQDVERHQPGPARSAGQRCRNRMRSSGSTPPTSCRRGGFGCHVEAVDGLDHRAGRRDHPGQHRCGMAHVLIWAD